MPKYKVEPEAFGLCDPAPPMKGKKHYPTVYFPVSMEILNELEVGKEATVTLIGTVVGLESRSNDQGEKNEVRLEIRQVEAYSDDEKKETMKNAVDKGLGYDEDEEKG